MTQDIFNPDFQIDGEYDASALAISERHARTRTEFDAEEDCLYDRSLCRQKLVRIMNWEKAVDYAATNKMNWVIRTSADMFYSCPVPHLNCVRRLRYLELLKHFQQQR